MSIELRSDNTAGVAPEVLEAITAANEGSALAYGGDDWTSRLQQRFGELFEHDVTVFPVGSGTAANSLALASLCPPWGAVICHDTAHILRSECGATSMFGGGVVVRGLPGAGARLAPDALATELATAAWGDPHVSQPAVLSLTVPSDRGTICTPDEVGELVTIAKHHRLRAHLDGARFANAVVALGCTPAELTWRAGIDVLSFGALKNGGLSTDAIVSFDRDASAQLVYRTKRAGHVVSKMRFQAAQLEAYVTDGLWLRLAERANSTMASLAAGLDALGVELLDRPAVNMVFARVDDAIADSIEGAGLLFYRMGGGVVRLVTSWQTTAGDVEATLRIVGDALASRGRADVPAPAG